MHRLTATAFAACLVLSPAAAQAQDFPPERGQAPAPDFTEDEALLAAVESPRRSEAHRARDAHRRPFESLTFWGLNPGMTVVEIEPGSEAWWTEILAPYLAQAGGRYVAAWVDLANPQTSDGARAARAALSARLSDRAIHGEAAVVDFGPQSGLALPDASADMILVARAFHNWSRAEGRTERYMAEFFRVLKPGGILAVEQHRAEEGSDAAQTASTGYMPESYVIRAAEAAGFVLEARSELNANAMDDRDHAFGVWTLPPTRLSVQGERRLTPAERSRYDAIGESDRMTLRFRRPEASAE